MGLRVPWQDQYLICQSSTISEAKDFSAGSIGLEADKYVLPLTNHPHLSSGQNIINTEKSLGMAYRQGKIGYEYQAGTRLPVVTLEFDFHEKLMGLLTYLFFQNGTHQAAGPGYGKSTSKWTNPEPEIYCNIAKVMSDSSADSFRIRGGICRSFTISGREGESLKVSVEIVGAYIDNDFNASVAIFNWSVPPSGRELFQDFSTVDIFVGDANYNNVSLNEFSFTVNNNARPRFYNSRNPVSFILGKLTGSCSCVLNWSQASIGGQKAFEELKSASGGKFEMWMVVESPHDLNPNGIIQNVEVISEEQCKVRIETELAYLSGTAWQDYPLFMAIIDSVDRGIT